MSCENCCPFKDRIERLEKALSGAEVFIPPTVDQVVDFLTHKKGIKYSESMLHAEKFIKNSENNGWKISTGEPMKEWRSACSAWFNNQKFESAQRTLEDQIKYEQFKRG